MKKRLRKISERGLAALIQAVPVPGLSLLLNKRVRSRVRQATGLALLGGAVVVSVPLALYVICKTSKGTARTN